MIISFQKKFIFISIQKTASTSIRKKLERHNCINASCDINSLIYNHTSACRLKLYFKEKKIINKLDEKWNWKNYFKFTFVRNPYARIVSQYNYFCKIGNGPQTVKDSNGNDFTYENNFYSLCKKTKNESFNNFLKKPENFDVPYSWFCLDEFDFIGKTENLQKDFNKVIENINKNSDAKPLDSKKLHHLNKSTLGDYQDFFDYESKKIVEKFYGEDIERFKYRFGE